MTLRNLRKRFGFSSICFANLYRSRVSLFPFQSDGDLYFLLITGSEVDVQKINSSPETVFKHISSTIGRELEFVELVWSGTWSVNVRMVNKFGEGRVFVGGGEVEIIPPLLTRKLMTISPQRRRPCSHPSRSSRDELWCSGCLQSRMENGPRP